MLSSRTDWPHSRNGFRRRATARVARRRARVLAPAGWVLRLFVLCVIAIPSLIYTHAYYLPGTH
jgi:hypothetical protein